ncbi:MULTISPECIES: XRE family transcriptional regulator [Paraburkholderia]|uniref:XRE family transcriptional regulator n=1 Tax=Paraburkholderia TaxID=1822464 RepID=UPI0027DFFF8D|nr:XRE family transcriptional regulator [Paraburkholderia aspalathi]
MELLEHAFQTQSRSSEWDCATAPSTILDCRSIAAYRKAKKESQMRFWARFGVSQSQGSRIECGAGIPESVSILLGLYFIEAICDEDLGRAKFALRIRGCTGLVGRHR